MQISTELRVTEALAANRLLTQPLDPSKDISLHVFLRTANQVVITPLAKYYGERFPPNELDVL